MQGHIRSESVRAEQQSRPTWAVAKDLVLFLVRKVTIQFNVNVNESAIYIILSTYIQHIVFTLYIMPEILPILFPLCMYVNK